MNDLDLELKNPFTSMKTTEIHVTSESATLADNPIDLLRPGHRPTTPNGRPQYSVTVSSHIPQRTPSLSLSVPAPTLPPTSASGNKSFSTIPASERPQRQLLRSAAMEANSAAWGYTKVAVLFFTAMLVTWIPSSANRVYSVVRPDEISAPLQFASAFVLPLQGFWNAVIYIMTSWAACKYVFGKAVARLPSGGKLFQRARPREDGSPVYAMHGRPQRRASGKGSQTESMTELASRKVSQELGWEEIPVGK